MPINDLRGKAVLVTGGTMGIGLATGLAFGREGARCVLTHRWGTADEGAVRARFAEAGAPEPLIVEADVADAEATGALLAAIHAEHEAVEAFVSNVSVALVVKDLADYSPRALSKSIEYSAWPMVEYPRRIAEVFGRYPRYVVGLSSGGPDAYYQNYDFAAASKAVAETLCRYLTYRLYDEDVRVNVVRSRLVRTESLRATFGADFEEFAARYTAEGDFIGCDEVAGAILALCSGLMDGVRGQVIMVDRGTSFCDNLMRLYDQRFELGLGEETG